MSNWWDGKAFKAALAKRLTKEELAKLKEYFDEHDRDSTQHAA
jgi:hypothetical protein